MQSPPSSASSPSAVHQADPLEELLIRSGSQRFPAGNVRRPAHTRIVLSVNERPLERRRRKSDRGAPAVDCSPADSSLVLGDSRRRFGVRGLLSDLCPYFCQHPHGAQPTTASALAPPKQTAFAVPAFAVTPPVSPWRSQSPVCSLWDRSQPCSWPSLPVRLSATRRGVCHCGSREAASGATQLRGV